MTYMKRKVLANNIREYRKEPYDKYNMFLEKDRKYYPKQGLCVTCVNMLNDCSSLDFSSMPIFRKSERSAQVNCTSYSKR